MTELDLLTFKQAITEANNSPHAILGNGFSVACRPDIFSYDQLLDRAELSERPEARAAFDRLGTTNFEMVIRALFRGADLIDVYGTSDPDLAKRFRHDAEALKEVLVQAIAGSHPDRPAGITDTECQSAKRFLAHFRQTRSQKIYLLNYDLLTYWALMRNEVNPQISFDDGFRQPEGGPEAWVEWDSNRHNQTLFYLHGGLHIYQAGPEIRKFTWLNTQIPLMDQIRQALSENHYPLYVAEGTWQDKLSRIRRSDFLGRGRRSFKAIGGTLFVYGMSMQQNDDHILHAIVSGNVKQLFVSMYGDPISPENQALRQRADALVERRAQLRGERANPLTVRFYDAESAAVWSAVDA